MKKKILYVITKSNWGGAQRYVYDLATNLPKEQFEVAVALGGSGLLREKLESAGVVTHLIPGLQRDISLVRELRALFNLRALFRKLSPDVVHLNSSKAAGLGALVARLCGVRTIVFTVHGWPFKERRNVLARSVIYLASWVAALLSTVITVSRTDEALAQRMPGVHTQFIPLGIALPVFLGRGEAEHALGLATALPRVVTIAELTLNKGVDRALAAIAELVKRGVNVHYTVIGEGTERAALERLIAEYRIHEHVTLHGFMPDAAQYLRAFDVLLLPSLKEGTPYVLLEAAAAGLPIVTTSAVDASLAHELGAVVCDSDDAHSLANALERAWKLDDTHAKPHFPLASMIAETARLY